METLIKVWEDSKKLSQTSICVFILNRNTIHVSISVGVYVWVLWDLHLVVVITIAAIQNFFLYVCLF